MGGTLVWYLVAVAALLVFTVWRYKKGKSTGGPKRNDAFEAQLGIKVEVPPDVCTTPASDTIDPKDDRKK